MASLTSLLTSYDFVVISARDLSYGLASSWKKSSIKVLNTWGFSSRVGLEFFHTGLNRSFKVINIYVPTQTIWLTGTLFVITPYLLGEI